MEKILITFVLSYSIMNADAQITHPDFPDQVIMRDDILTYRTLQKISLINGFDLDKMTSLQVCKVINRDTMKFSVFTKKCSLDNLHLVKLKNASSNRKGSILPILIYAAFQEGEFWFYQFSATGLTKGTYAIFFDDKPNVFSVFKVASNQREKSLPSIEFEF